MVSGFIPPGEKLNSAFELSLVCERVEVIHLQADEFGLLVSGRGVSEKIINLVRAWTGIFRVGKDAV